jgi:Mor family transcriptional regulator
MSYSKQIAATEKRNARIYKERIEGKKIKELAKLYGVSICRINQIIARQKELQVASTSL